MPGMQDAGRCWSDHQAEAYSEGDDLLAIHAGELICDEVLLLRKGKLVESGSPAKLLEKFGRKNLEEVFLEVAGGNQANR